MPVWQTRRRTLDLSHRGAIMGVLNVTPDSFSDGGSFVDPDVACAQALKLAAEGADIIDVGGESTRPGAEPVAADVELARVLPVIERLRTQSDILISIDTWKASVAAAAIKAGADIVNDVTGLTGDAAMAAVARDSGAVKEFGWDRTGTERANLYTFIGQLVVQRLSKGQHVRFCSVIDGHTGPRNERSDGRDVENTPSISLDARYKA